MVPGNAGVDHGNRGAKAGVTVVPCIRGVNSVDTPQQALVRESRATRIRRYGARGCHIGNGHCRCNTYILDTTQAGGVGCKVGIGGRRNCDTNLRQGAHQRATGCFNIRRQAVRYLVVFH